MGSYPVKRSLRSFSSSVKFLRIFWKKNYQEKFKKIWTSPLCHLLYNQNTILLQHQAKYWIRWLLLAKVHGLSSLWMLNLALLYPLLVHRLKKTKSNVLYFHTWSYTIEEDETGNFGKIINNAKQERNCQITLFIISLWFFCLIFD